VVCVILTLLLKGYTGDDSMTVYRVTFYLVQFASIDEQPDFC
jgi:hypothetical protein